MSGGFTLDIEEKVNFCFNKTLKNILLVYLKETLKTRSIYYFNKVSNNSLLFYVINRCLFDIDEKVSFNNILKERFIIYHYKVNLCAFKTSKN